MTDLVSSNPEAGVAPYSDWIRQLVFGQYILGDRNAAAAHRATLELWDEEWGDPPSVKTVQRWARIHNWDAEADRLIAETYPMLYQRDIARLVALRSRSISCYAQLIEGTYHGKNPMAAVQAAKHTLELTIAGMAVQAPGTEGTDQEELSPQERAVRQRQRLERGRGGA